MNNPLNNEMIEFDLEQDYQIVVLDSVYDSASNQETQALFPQMIQFKINGYLQEYPYGVLPMDASDFVGTHLLILRKSDRAIVVGMKSITLAKCLLHQIRFPMLGILESHQDDTRAHQQAVQRVMDQYQQAGKAHLLSYNGSYTVHPEVRANKPLMKVMWEVSQAMMVNFYLEQQTEQVMAVCSRQFKIDRVKKNLGWDYFYHTNENQITELGEYHCQALGNSLFLPMTVKQHSEFALDLAKKYQILWEQRIVVQNNTGHSNTNAEKSEQPLPA